MSDDETGSSHFVLSVTGSRVRCKNFMAKSFAASLEWLADIGIDVSATGDVSFRKPFHTLLNDLRSNVESCDSNAVNGIKESLSKCLSDKDALALLLSPAKHSIHSPIQLLLNNECFQMHIVSILCDFLVSDSYNEPSEKSRNMLSKIICNMQYLDKIYDQSSLIDPIFEVIDVLHASMKPILIQSLHLIFSCSDDLIQRLIKLMKQDSSLTQDLLVVFDGLDMDDQTKNRIRDVVLTNALSSATKNLPPVIQFLVKTTDSKNVSTTLTSFRDNLVIASQNSEDSQDNEDSYIFLILQLKNALQFNNDFCKGYLKCLEDLNTLKVLDVWILFCLFSIPCQRPKVIPLLSKLPSNQLEKVGKDAIEFHSHALSSLVNSITDLVSLCLQSQSESVVAFGSAIAIYLFDDVDSISVQQDIIATILIQFSRFNKENAMIVIEKISVFAPQKLSLHLEMLSGLLYSYETFDFSFFTRIVKVIAKITFDNIECIDKESNFQIFTKKLLSSAKVESKKYGIVAASAILRALCESKDCQIDQIVKQFNQVMNYVENDPICTNQFYSELNNVENRSKEINELLIDQLTRELNNIISERCRDKTEWFALDDGNQCIDFLSAVTVKQKNNGNSAYVFTQSGLKLLFNCHKMLGNDINEKLGKYFKMPLRLYDLDEVDSDFTSSVRLQILLYAHSWITELLNFFSSEQTDDCWARMEHRREIEMKIISALSEEIVFIHPIFGEMFPRSSTHLKKTSSSIFGSFLFVSHYQGSFSPPSISILNMLIDLKFPIDETKRRHVLRILSDYKYMLKPPKKSLFPIQPLSNPSMTHITTIAKEILPNVINSEDQTDRLIFKTCIEIITILIELPIYKTKDTFSSLLKGISSKDRRGDCFDYFADMMLKGLPIGLQVIILQLLKSILHAGPPRKKDVEGVEYIRISNICRDLLKSGSSHLNLKNLKIIIPIFFDHNPSLLDDIQDLALNAFNSSVTSGEPYSSWPTLKSDSFPLYFKYCISSLTKKLIVMEKQLKNRTSFCLSEGTTQILVENLNRFCFVMKRLLQSVSNESAPFRVRKQILINGSMWMDCCVNLLPLISDAQEVDTRINIFYKDVRVIQKILQAQMEYARIHDKALQKTILPKVSMTLEKWSYNLKCQYVNILKCDISLRTMRRRTLDGELVKSQLVET